MNEYMSEQFRQDVEAYRKIDWEALLKKGELGDNHLGALKPEFDFIREVWDSILNHPQLEQIYKHFQGVLDNGLNVWMQLANSVKQHTDYARNQEIISNVYGYRYNDISQNLQPVLTSLNLEEKYGSDRKGMGQNVKQARKSAREIEAILAKFVGWKALHLSRALAAQLNVLAMNSKTRLKTCVLVIRRWHYVSGIDSCVYCLVF